MYGHERIQARALSATDEHLLVVELLEVAVDRLGLGRYLAAGRSEPGAASRAAPGAGSRGAPGAARGFASAAGESAPGAVTA